MIGHGGAGRAGPRTPSAPSSIPGYLATRRIVKAQNSTATAIRKVAPVRSLRLVTGPE